MPTDLHEQLAAELGLSSIEAEHALNDLLHDVRDRVRAGEEVSLRGLGTFFEDADALRFAPDPHLAKAVNYRNDHLAPLTVGGRAASASPEEPDEPDDSGDRPEAASAASVEDDLPTLEAPLPPPAEPLASAETALDEAVPDEAPAEPEPAEPEPDIAALSDDWARELDLDAPLQGPRPPTPQKGKAPANADASSASKAQVAGLVGSVLVLLLLLWFVLDKQGLITGPGGLFAGEGGSSTDTAAVATATVPTSGDDQTVAARSSDTELPPPTIDRTTGGWTIVVASRTRPDEAKRVLETYQQSFTGDSTPVDILTGAAGDAMRYRVAVGQYPSRAAAISARRQLQDQDRLPDDAWPLRIQPNS